MDKTGEPRGAPGCTCGTPPFAPPEPSADCPYHGENSPREPIHGDDLPRPDDDPDIPMPGDTW